MLDLFNNYFFQYLSGMGWWQGLIILTVMTFILLVGKFWRNTLSFLGIKIYIGKLETLHYRMFWGLSNDAINIKMKDEIRRSFKENGFCELNEKEFLQYINNQSKNLIYELKNHIINLYPTSNNEILVSMEEILEQIDINRSKYDSYFLEIYMEAKKFKKQNDEEIELIDKKFEQEITNFVKNKTTSDCGSCIMIMFGKKLIADNKKSKFKTLKSQMNFAEQKLTEIHSSLISFYSEKVNEKKKIK